MKKNVLLFGAFTLILAGCHSTNSAEEKQGKQEGASANVENSASEDSNQPPELQTEQKSNEDDPKFQQPLTPEEVIQETKKQLKTEIPVQLPISIAVSSCQHLAAKTSSEEDRYVVSFVEMEVPVPINNDEMKNKEANVAVLKGTRYETAEKAAEQINHQDHSGNGAPSVDLGFGVKGYRDAGAGSQFIGWNEGRWSLAVRARTDQGESITAEAKQIVQFLEQNMLPAPRDVGAAMFDINEDDDGHTQHITWQENDVVYEIETNKGYMTALEIAVSIQGNKSSK